MHTGEMVFGRDVRFGLLRTERTQQCIAPVACNSICTLPFTELSEWNLRSNQVSALVHTSAP